MEATLVSVTTMLLVLLVVVVVEVVVVEGGGGCVSSCPEMSLLHDEGPAESSPFSPPSPSPPTASSDHITTEDDFGELPERGRFFFECFGTKNNEKNSSLGENVCDKLMEGSVNVTRNTRRGACGGTYLVDNGAWVEMQLPSEQHTCDVLIKAANNTRLTIHCPTFRLGARHEEVLFLTHGDSLGGLYYLQRRPSLPAGVRQLYLMYARGQKEALKGSAAACVVVGRDFEREGKNMEGSEDRVKWTQANGCGKMCGEPAVVGGMLRILGGEKADDTEFPWVALVHIKIGEGFSTCGASILTDSTVLTAAHCLYKSEEVTVIVGKPDLTGSNSDTQIIEPKDIVIHPAYDYETHAADIALLVLEEKIEWGTHVQPVCVSHSEIGEGDLAVIAGWGLTDTEGQDISTSIQKVTIDIVSHEECKTKYRTWNVNVLDTQVCAASPGKDSCQGDSGGPLMMLVNNIWYQVGVISKGIGCGDPRFPGIYTRISSFKDWILENVKGSCNS